MMAMLILVMVLMLLNLALDIFLIVHLVANKPIKIPIPNLPGFRPSSKRKPTFTDDQKAWMMENGREV